jgi:hypothetical protein
VSVSTTASSWSEVADLEHLLVDQREVGSGFLLVEDGDNVGNAARRWRGGRRAVCAWTDSDATESKTAATMTVVLQRNPSNIACVIVAPPSPHH